MGWTFPIEEWMEPCAGVVCGRGAVRPTTGSWCWAGCEATSSLLRWCRGRLRCRAVGERYVTDTPALAGEDPVGVGVRKRCESLILAQDERWRRALRMQVGRALPRGGVTVADGCGTRT